MTAQEHEEIFAKEALTIKDVMKLFDLAYPTASEFIRKAKTKLKMNGNELRIDVQGRLHVLDYYDYIRVGYADRYPIKNKEEVKI